MGTCVSDLNRDLKLGGLHPLLGCSNPMFGIHIHTIHIKNHWPIYFIVVLSERLSKQDNHIIHWIDSPYMELKLKPQNTYIIPKVVGLCPS